MKQQEFPVAAKSKSAKESGLSQDLINWMIGSVREEPDTRILFAELCNRLHDRGVPISRATMYLFTHHPEWLGARFVWQPGKTMLVETFDYDVRSSPPYLLSPVRELDQGANEVRRTLSAQTDEKLEYPLYRELRDEGMTDYAAWPLKHTLQAQHAVTFATNAEGGFAPETIEALRQILPTLSLVSEIGLKDHVTKTLLETYVGPPAAKQILAGATTRGSGVTIKAAILVCDMRGFTSLSNDLPRDEVIALLNDFFDAAATPVERNGGEILKFMGDGFLAIFPTSDPLAAKKLIATVEEAQHSLASLSEARDLGGLPRFDYGIGVHVGEVMYGNIGSQRRLDFTVVGPALNIAARLETLTKSLGCRVLFSEAFVELAGGKSEFSHAGDHMIRGVNSAISVYARHQKASAMQDVAAG